MTRSLPVVIDRMLQVIPESEDDLRRALVSIKDRVAYCAPERMHELWNTVAEVLGFHAPRSAVPVIVPTWQNELAAILMGNQ